MRFTTSTLRRTSVAVVVAVVVAIVLIVAGISLATRIRSHGLADKTSHAYVAYAAEIVPLKHQRLLVTDFGYLDREHAQVLITDFSDRLLWRYSGYLNNPHSAYPLHNGNLLIADTGDNRVIEVNRKSHIVWDTDDLGGGRGKLGQGRMSDGTRLDYPNDAKRLPNGNILISCRLQNRVIEITRKGRIVRDVHGFLNRQHNPDVLPNGDLLIADSGWNRVVEVNRHNRIVWKFGGAHQYSLSWPRDANLLRNGNILVVDSDHNRLVEVTRSHHMVRYWTGLQRPYSVASLPNGNILVGDGPGPGIVELNSKDEIVWKLNVDQKQYLRGISYRLRNGDFEKAAAGSQRILSAWNRDDALAYSLQPNQRVSIVRDCQVHLQGRCSGRITYHGDSNGIYLNQFVRVQPGHYYRFTGWIKTRSVRPCHPCVYGPGGQPGHTAEYELGFDPGQGAYPQAPSLPHLSGTTGWTKQSIKFVIPSGVHLMEIDGYLRGQGSVWFDGISLKKVG